MSSPRSPSIRASRRIRPTPGSKGRPVLAQFVLAAAVCTAAASAQASAFGAAAAPSAQPVAEGGLTPSTGQRAGSAASSSAALELEGRGLSLGSPVSRVYRSVDANGRVVFGDAPVPHARSVEVRSFAASSDPQALETARRQQAYWRAQAEAFEARRKQREETERRAREEAASQGPGYPAVVLVVPRNLRAPWLGQPGPIAPPGAFPPVYPSTPGAAAGAPAAFIGSGFSTAR